MISRRRALGTLALPALAAAGCAGGGPRVRVAVVWSGWELASFRTVLAGFTRATGIGVTVISAGDDLEPLLGERIARISAPDVAMVPQPGLVARYHDRLRPVDPELTDNRPTPWNGLLTHQGRLYGLWFKAAHKSLVWHRPHPALAVPPDSLDRWEQAIGAVLADGQVPLAIGAADGWVLTDWFENVLLGRNPEVYRRLAATRVGWGAGRTGAAVRDALTRLARLWSIPGAILGGAENALTTQFEEALVQVFGTHRAVMAAGADYAYPIISRFGRAGGDAAAPGRAAPDPTPRWFSFPGAHAGAHPVIVGGDAAVQLRRSGAAGTALMEWLAGREAAELWARRGGFLSLDPEVGHYPAAQIDPAGFDRLRREVTGLGPGPITFDLSDQLGGRLAGGNGRGSWQIFQDFFAEVGASGRDESRIGQAVDRAVGALDAAAGGSG